jgi:hypothetical protein
MTCPIRPTRTWSPTSLRRRPVLGAQRLPAALAVGYGPEPLVTPAVDAVLDAAGSAGIELPDFL